MCEGVFLFLQLFKLTTSNWFGHTVRVQRVHEVRGTSAWTNRSGAETHEVRGTSAWTDRSGDHKFNFRWFNHGLNAANSLQSP